MVVGGGGLKLRVEAAAGLGGFGVMVKVGMLGVVRERWAGMGWMGERGRVGLRIDFTAGWGASCGCVSGCIKNRCSDELQRG